LNHPFENYLICRNNYLPDPDAVAELAEGLYYQRATCYPGRRTDNLLTSSNPKIKEFAEWFADRLGFDIFPGISLYNTFLCFHINEPHENEEFNVGWIHNDYGNLAGLIYLTAEEDNFDSGTSIFTGYGEEHPTDAEARKTFHYTNELTEAYITGFRRNRSMFQETIKVGNQYNRLVAYDSKMYHRPNSFSTATKNPRLSLLFFVSEFTYNN
jgi:hypothetical protein